MDNEYFTPATVQWYLTKRCNLTCTHCYNYDHDESPAARKGELTREESLALLDRLADSGVVQINFLGGEVLTVPWLVDLAARAHEHGIGVGIATNGTLVTEAKAEAMRAASVGEVQISFDGTREAHDRIRGAGAFDRALRGLRLIRASGIPTKIAFTLMASNHHCLPDLVALARAEEVAYFKLHGYIPSGRSAAELAEIPSAEVVREAIARLREEEHASGGRLQVDFPCYTGHLGERARGNWRVGEKATRLSCGAGDTRGVIWEDGSVGACDFIRDPVGDLRTQSFREIWTAGHEAIEQWRRLDRVRGKCGSCGYQADCGFGCRANAFYGAGDFYEGDPGCISAPPEGEVHPYDLLREPPPARPRRISLPIAR